MKQLYCSIFGHNYMVSKNVTRHVKEYKCKHCGHEVTTNGNGKLIQLTPKHREINASLASMHSKRSKKRASVYS